MLRIRRFEERIAEEYKNQEMRCPTHLSIGQEAVPAAMSELVDSEDLAVSNHRSHAHYLSKGGDPNKFIAELYGKKSGTSGGKGGSMHLIDLNKGFKASTAIVGNTIPIGVGLGYAQKLRNKKKISIIYIGDGSVEEGVFYESMNIAILKKLPVLFICENNLYSVYTPLKKRQPSNRKIYKMVEAMGIETRFTDGNDVEKCFNLLKDTIKKIRKTSMPKFVEFSTYRWLEHCGPNFDNKLGYRTMKEFLSWKKRDPVLLYKNKLLKKKIINEKLFNKLKKEIDIEISTSFIFAKKSKFPNRKDAFSNLFKN